MEQKNANKECWQKQSILQYNNIFLSFYTVRYPFSFCYTSVILYPITDTSDYQHRIPCRFCICGSIPDAHHSNVFLKLSFFSELHSNIYALVCCCIFSNALQYRWRHAIQLLFILCLTHGRNLMA